MAHTLRVRVAATLTLAVLALTAGCSSSNIPDAPEGYTPPGWFLEESRAKAKFVAELQSCVTEKGWDVTIKDATGALETPIPDSGAAARFTTAKEGCIRSLGINPIAVHNPSRESVERIFDHKVDTANCLRVRGYEISTPPSQEIWADEYLSELANNNPMSATAATGQTTNADPVWDPYDNQPALSKVDHQDLAALMKACPQPWIFGAEQ